MTPDDRRRRPFPLSTLVPLTLLAAFAADARAEPGDRKFAVLLAAPVRSLGNPIPPLPNPNDVYDQYFDTVKSNVDSFAEFWDEISYGNVSISGDVLGWVEVPWPVLPQHSELTIDPEIAEFGEVSAAVLPYVELNIGGMQPFSGENFLEALQMTIVDQNGDGDGNGPQPSGLDDGGIWTPGERYLDLNNNGKYDALLEPTMDGDSSDGCGMKDGVIDGGEFCDMDEDGQWDFPEPFEDFLVVYRAEAIWPDDHWIKLDPSPNNTFEGSPDMVGSRQWAEAYIRTNYRGDADALIARCGNGQYDGPDFWFESAGAGSKRRREPSSVPMLSTPDPDATAHPWIFTFDQWWTAFWNEKHLQAGVTPIPAAPLPPEWSVAIPILSDFNPNDPSSGPLLFPCIEGRYSDLRTFCPNAGGDLARSGIACDPNPSDDPSVDCFDDPDDPNDFEDYVIDPAFPGDGTYFTTYGGATTDGVVMPDMLDTNLDGLFDWYDGPAEFDDLPSSIYHARDVSGLTDGFGGLLDGVNGGDGRLGEVTSPFSTSEFGVDRGVEDPNGPPIGGDGVIPPGGPGAYFVHGSGPFDGGNVLNLEYLTWLNDPAGPAAVDPDDPPDYNLAGVFKRDFTLDGLLDQGEVRKAGTENYVVDADIFTPNNGGPATRYPFNRRRLTEDTIAAIDPTVDWDYLVHQDLDIVKDYPVDVGNFLFCTVLLPEDVVGDGLAEAGRGLFQLPAPGMDLPIQVIESGEDQISPIWCSDFATGITGTTETGEPLTQNGFAKELLAHEFLHAWEGYPDLYDYDEYGGGIINKPMGRWDCMSGGGMVHPNPFLKEFGQGEYFVHEPWLDPIDLTRVLLPGREAQLVLPDYAFEPNGGAYYYGNPDRFLERFYFWRLTRIVPDDPEQINFSRSLPGDGFMIMHTDIGKFEGFPEQQRKATHFTFNIVQADGLQQLENGENAGDAGDPFPGNTNKLAWNHDSDPNSRWWEQAYSGIEIRNVVHQPDFSLVTFLWQPRVVPELHFVRPPGGDVVNDDFVIHYASF